MKGMAALAAAFALVTAPASGEVQEDNTASTFHDILDGAGFHGALAYSDTRQTLKSVYVGTPIPGPAWEQDLVWPWASMTKQVVAVMVMQAVEKEALALDDPVSEHLPAFGGAPPAPTIRQLLQHRSGLRNPDDSPMGADEWPTFYTDGPTGLDWCLAGRSAPPAEGWRYNNCDYLVLGAVLEKITGQPLAALFDESIAKPAGLTATRFATSRTAAAVASSEPRYAAILPRFGAAGGLIGPVTDMLRFDRALMDGRLLGENARDVLWTGDPALGYMALGQWVFSAPLKGCNEPVRMIERRGAIGKYQVRNIILPESGTTVALVTDRSEQDFDFGEIWTGKGPMHDVLATLACNP